MFKCRQKVIVKLYDMENPIYYKATIIAKCTKEFWKVRLDNGTFYGRSEVEVLTDQLLTLDSLEVLLYG